MVLSRKSIKSALRSTNEWMRSKMGDRTTDRCVANIVGIWRCAIDTDEGYKLEEVVFSEGRVGGRNCLRDNSGGLSSRDHRSDGRLPGQRFTGDEQCAFFWGRDYKVEIPAGRHHSVCDLC